MYINSCCYVLNTKLISNYLQHLDVIGDKWVEEMFSK